MSSQTTETVTTPRDKGTQASQQQQGSISGQTIGDKKSQREKASQIKSTASVIQTPPGHILKAAHDKKFTTGGGVYRITTKRKKKHRRRTRKGGHCGKSINKIKRLIKALKKEMKILERKQKSYYTKSKKVKKKANKNHIKTFKKLKLQLNKI